jgi:hypothetical protein
MMSVGKVVDSRQYLIAVGLLAGKIRRDPEYPQPVWHLRIPDIWEENIRWRKQINSLNERVELKKEITQRLKDSGQLRQFDSKTFDDPLLHVKRLHNMKAFKTTEKPPKIVEPSYCEGGPPQNEGGPPQNETKKNHKKNQIEPLEANASEKPEFDISSQGPKTQIMNSFIEKTKIPLPKRKKERDFWWSSISEIHNASGHNLDSALELLEVAINRLRQDGLTISDPNSLIKTIRAIVGERASGIDISTSINKSGNGHNGKGPNIVERNGKGVLIIS